MDSTDSKSPSKQASAINNFTVQKLPILVSVIETKISWPIANQCFFSLWKSKVPVKPICALFSTFSRIERWLSRTLFSNFSRTIRNFHGHFGGIFTDGFFVSRVRNREFSRKEFLIFTGRVCYTKGYFAIKNWFLLGNFYNAQRLKFHVCDFAEIFTNGGNSFTDSF